MADGLPSGPRVWPDAAAGDADSPGGYMANRIVRPIPPPQPVPATVLFHRTPRATAIRSSPLAVLCG
jgi:hypothetical protein